MVTRKCALESSNQQKDKKIQDLEARVSQLEKIVAQFEQNAVTPLPASSVASYRMQHNNSDRNVQGTEKGSATASVPKKQPSVVKSEATVVRNESSSGDALKKSIESETSKKQKPQPTQTAMIDSREEQRKAEDSRDQSASLTITKTEQAQETAKIKQEDEISISQRSNPARTVSSGTRPRSRPSDKQPAKRGNSSSSQQNNTSANERTQLAKENGNLVDENDEDGDEDYEPHFDEDEDDGDDEEKKFLAR